MPFRSQDHTDRLVAAYREVETLLFEVLGGWVRSTPEPDVKVFLAAASRRHGWHAGLWRELGGPAAASSGGHSGSTFRETLAGGAADTVERLTAAFEVVLPRLEAAYQAHLGAASELREGPIARRLRVVLHDVGADRAEGQALLRARAADPSAAARSEAHRARLAGMIEGPEGLFGVGLRHGEGPPGAAGE